MTTTLSIDFKKVAVFAAGAIFALSLFAAPVQPAQAETMNDDARAEIIEMLTVQIAELQKQLLGLLQSSPIDIDTGAVSPQPTPQPTPECRQFTKSMYIGANDASTNGEVTALQEYLTSTGDYTYGKATGYYGPSTMAAVKKWQARNGIVSYGTPDSTGYGLVGKKTRDAIKNACNYDILGYKVYPYDKEMVFEPGDQEASVAVVSVPSFSKDRYLNKLTVEFINHTGSDSVWESFEEINLQIDGRTVYSQDVRDIDWARLKSDIRPRYKGVLFDSEEEGHGIKIPAGVGLKAVASVEVNEDAEDSTWIFTISNNGIELWSALTGSVERGDHDTDSVTFEIDSSGPPSSENYIEVTEPEEGDKFDIDDEIDIEWRQGGISTLSIALYQDNKWVHWIKKDARSNGLPRDSYDWEIPSNIESIIDGGENLKIYITGRYEDGTGYADGKSEEFSIDFDDASETFSLSASDYDTVSGDSVTYTIVGDQNVTPYVELRTECDENIVTVSAKGGHTCDEATIIEFPEKGIYRWTEWYTVTEDTTIRFEATGLDKYKRQQISAPFEYVEVEVSSVDSSKEITLTSPNGGERWETRRTNTITWKPYNYRPDINASQDVTAYLETKDRYGRYKTVGEILDNGKASIHTLLEIDRYGNYADSGEYYVRIVNNRTGATDRSDRSFTIEGEDKTIDIELSVDGTTRPGALVRDTLHTIEWRSSGVECNAHGSHVKMADGRNLNDLNGLPPSGELAFYATHLNFENVTSLQMSISCGDGADLRGSETIYLQVVDPTSPNDATGSITSTTCELPDNDSSTKTCEVAVEWETELADGVKVFVNESGRLMSAGRFGDVEVNWVTMSPRTLVLMHGCTSNTMRSCEGTLDSTVLVASCSKGFVQDKLACVPDDQDRPVSVEDTVPLGSVQGASTSAAEQSLASIIVGVEKLIEALKEFVSQ